MFGLASISYFCWLVAAVAHALLVVARSEQALSKPTSPAPGADLSPATIGDRCLGDATLFPIMLLLAVVGALALRLNQPHIGRREVNAAAVAAIVLPAPASTANEFPELDAKIAKQLAMIRPQLKAVAAATTAGEFSDAADQLVLWIISKGEIPEGVDAKAIRDVLRTAYLALPQRAYGCEMTRTNKGICYSPGEPADSAYESALKYLRKYATRKGKGVMMSDGVSAANSAAF